MEKPKILLDLSTTSTRQKHPGFRKQRPQLTWPCTQELHLLSTHQLVHEDYRPSVYCPIHMGTTYPVLHMPYHPSHRNPRPPHTVSFTQEPKPSTHHIVHTDVLCMPWVLGATVTLWSITEGRVPARQAQVTLGQSGRKGCSERMATSLYPHQGEQEWPDDAYTGTHLLPLLGAGFPHTLPQHELR